WPEQIQVVERGNDFLDTYDRDMDLRKSGGEPGVALVFSYRHTACIGYQEITPCDAHVGRGVLLPEEFAGFECQRFGCSFGWRAEMLMEQRLDVRQAQVHGGCYNMVRLLPEQLHNVFAEVGLDGFDVVFTQEFIEIDFF